jgi:hypothetical protein
VNLTLAVAPLAVLVLALMLVMLDAMLEASDSREPLFFCKLMFRAAPVGLYTILVDGLLLDGDLLTLCMGANRPCLGGHSKYLDQWVS